ncbi:15619_t:CDS:2, partial [Acaulospora colombiana]
VSSLIIGGGNSVFRRWRRLSIINMHPLRAVNVNWNQALCNPTPNLRFLRIHGLHFEKPILPYAPSLEENKVTFETAFGVEPQVRKKLSKPRPSTDPSSALMRPKTPNSDTGTATNFTTSGRLTEEGETSEAYRMTPITSQPLARQPPWQQHQGQTLQPPSPQQSESNQRWSSIGLAILIFLDITLWWRSYTRPSYSPPSCSSSFNMSPIQLPQEQRRVSTNEAVLHVYLEV